MLVFACKLLCPAPTGRGIKRWCRLSDVCRVHREYSWRPRLLEARRAGRRRSGVRRVWPGAGPQRAAYRGGGISWRPPAYNLYVQSLQSCIIWWKTNNVAVRWQRKSVCCPRWVSSFSWAQPLWVKNDQTVFSYSRILIFSDVQNSIFKIVFYFENTK